MLAPVPHPGIEGDRAVPDTGRDRWAMDVPFASGLSLGFVLPPASQVGVERTGRPQRGIDGCPAKVGRDLGSDLSIGHDRVRILFGLMGQLFQRREGFFVG